MTAAITVRDVSIDIPIYDVAHISIKRLLLGKAYFVIAGARLGHTYFLIERYRPLAGTAALARRRLSPMPHPMRFAGYCVVQLQMSDRVGNWRIAPLG